MNAKDFKKYIKQGHKVFNTKGAGLSIVSTVDKPFCYPFRESISGNVVPSSAVVVAVENTKSKGRHNVVVTYSYGRGFDFFCGDSYLEGGSKTTQNLDGIMEEFEYVCLDYEMSESEISKARNEALKVFDSMEKSTGCNFWSVWSKNQSICKHVAMALVQFDPSAGFLSTQTLIDHYEQSYGFSKPDFSSASEPADPLKLAFDHYAFRKHLIVEGDKGAGKTFLSTTYLSDFNVVRFDGSSAVEAIDLKGYLIRYADGDGEEKTVWQDGALSNAFRQAQAGVKTVLFIDEIGRIPTGEQSIFVAPLTKDNEGFYSFNTGRVVSIEDGVAQMEILKVPAENLWVVGTTNVGATYNVDEFEPALQDRFRYFRLDTNIAYMRQVLTIKCEERGFNVNVVNSLVNFYESMLDFKRQGMVSHDCNLRHMAEILELAEDEDSIVDEAERTLNLWVGREIENGQLIADEVMAVKALLNEVFEC